VKADILLFEVMLSSRSQPELQKKPSIAAFMLTGFSSARSREDMEYPSIMSTVRLVLFRANASVSRTSKDGDFT
jgi:hypothetical protein